MYAPKTCLYTRILPFKHHSPSDWWNSGMQSVKIICPEGFLQPVAKRSPLTAQWGYLAVCRIIFAYARGSSSTSKFCVSWMDVILSKFFVSLFNCSIFEVRKPTKIEIHFKRSSEMTLNKARNITMDYIYIYRIMSEANLVSLKYLNHLRYLNPTH